MAIGSIPAPKTTAAPRKTSPQSWWVGVLILCALLGALLALSFKTQTSLRKTATPSNSYAGLLAQYLVVEKHAADGAREIASLRAQQARWESMPSQTKQVRMLTEDLANAKFVAGLTEIAGPGVVVVLNDSKKRFSDAPLAIQMTGIVHDTDILQVVNELRAAGAEGVSVNDQRLVATSPIRCAGPTIYINGTPQTPPYTVRAIGDSTVLETALKLPQGIYDTLHSLDAGMIRIQKAAKVDIPAYNGLTTPRYAHPVVPASTANAVPSAGDSTGTSSGGDASGDTSASAKTEPAGTSVALSEPSVLPSGKE